MRKKVLTAVSCLMVLMAAGCSDDDTRETGRDAYGETFTQISTIDALLSGIYDGVISFGDLKEYGDFGIGTFEGLDGEMLAMDGEFFQVRADGVAYEVSDQMTSPFAQLVFFDVDKSLELGDEITFENLDETIDAVIPTENIFYAVMIEGTFDYIKTRSVPAQIRPYPPLVEVTANQTTFEFSDVTGTIVGFRSPPYMDGVGVPGYHLHFLTDDHGAGGHVLDIEVKEARAYLDYTSDFYMILPPDGSDFYQTDLTRDRSAELGQAESE